MAVRSSTDFPGAMLWRSSRASNAIPVESHSDSKTNRTAAIGARRRRRKLGPQLGRALIAPAAASFRDRLDPAGLYPVKLRRFDLHTTRASCRWWPLFAWPWRYACKCAHSSDCPTPIQSAQRPRLPFPPWAPIVVHILEKMARERKFRSSNSRLRNRLEKSKCHPEMRF